MPDPIVQLEGIHKTYSVGKSGLHVLKGVDFWPDVEQWLAAKMVR